MPNSTLAQMGFLDEDTQQEAVYDLEDTQARSDISTINGKIPSTASSSNKMATASDITDINNKIPSNASSSNKLATISDVSAAYKPKGNATLATLPSLTAEHLNWVYNMTEDFTTTSDFAEGAGKSVKAGNEVGIIDVSTTSTPSYKYTVLGGFVDTSSLQPKTLDTPVEVGGVNRTTVEAALGALANDKEDTILAATPLVKEYDEIMHQEVLRLNQDDAPTNNSNNPVKSGGIYTALADKASKANVIANTKLIKDTVGWSGKNKLPITLEQLKADNTVGTWNGNVYTYQGTTYTVRTDRNGYVEDITVNSSNVTASHNFSLIQKAQLEYLLDYIGEDFILNGCPSGGSDSTYRLSEISLHGIDGTTLSDYGEGKQFTLGDFSSYENDAYIVIRAFQGANISNKVFKPMLRSADILDPTYEPYFGSTAFPRSEQAVLGAKNLFKNTGANETVATVVFTHNSDDSTGLSGTTSETAFYTLGSLANLVGITENVKLTGCPEGGSTSDGISISVRTAGKKNVRYNNIDIVDTGNGFVFNPSAQLKDSDGNNVNLADLLLVVRIGRSVNTTGKVLYPMLRLASDPDNTYVPYAMTNRELTEEVAKRSVTLTKNDDYVSQFVGNTICEYDLLTRICIFSCIVRFSADVQGGAVLITGLPKAKNGFGFIGFSTSGSTYKPLGFILSKNSTQLNAQRIDTGAYNGLDYYISGSYIIADDVVS